MSKPAAKKPAPSTVLAAIQAILARSAGRSATVVIDSMIPCPGTSPKGTLVVHYHHEAPALPGWKGRPTSTFAVPTPFGPDTVSWKVTSDPNGFRGRTGDIGTSGFVPASLPMGI